MTIMLVSLLAFVACSDPGKPPPRAINGILDLSNWDLEKDGPVKLNGEWEFYWKEFINPEDYPAKPISGKKDYLVVPSHWLSYITRSYPQYEGLNKGYGTYILKITGLPEKNRKDLALSLKAIQSSYSLHFVPAFEESALKLQNKSSRPLMMNGMVGMNERESIPEFIPQMKRIPSYAGSNYIIIHISNYFFSTIGLTREMTLGTEDNLRALSNRYGRISFLMMGVILIMGVYHLVFFIYRRQEPEHLLFGLICFFISLWFLMWDGFFGELLPGESFVKFLVFDIMAIFSYSILLPLFALLYRLLFRHFVRRSVVVAAWAAAGTAFLLRVFKLPIDHYIFFYFNIAIIGFALTMLVILVQAAVNRVPGAVLSMLGFALFIIAISHDILQANLIIFSDILAVPYGLTAFILTQNFIFAKEYGALLAGIARPDGAVNCKRYAKSYLNGIDVEQIMLRLKQLMENDKIFRDEDLSVKSLSGELSLTVHQLSELLNDRLNSNFFNYVNSFRVMEAKQLLRDSRERSIISIAYDVGFNSATSFYRTFKKITGITPNKYRENG